LRLSDITGGNFSNGAITGAFGYLFNSAAHQNRPGSYKISDELAPAQITAIPANIPEAAIDALVTAGYEANQSVPSWIPQPLRGIFVHLEFANLVRELGPEYEAEASYINRVPAYYGQLGSVRADAIFGPVNQPVFAFDLKTGNAYVTVGQYNRYMSNLPFGMPLIEQNVK